MNEPSPTSNDAGDKGRNHLLGGAAALGAVGMIVLGVVVLGDGGDPPAEGELGDLVIREGLADDNPIEDNDLPPFEGSDADTINGDEQDDDTITGGDQDGDTLIGSDDDDTIRGESGDDILSGSGDSDTLDGEPANDDSSADPDALLGEGDAIVDPEAYAPGIDRLCANTQHSPPPGQESSASGIWVRGEVYGFDGGWIWVEGPTINNGDPVEIPVEDDGTFDGPLGINSYGDHPIESFELRGDGSEPVDLLSSIVEALGTDTFTVGPDEGPIFDAECFTIDRPGSEPSAAGGDSEAQPGDDAAGETPPGDPIALQLFYDTFATAHLERDIEQLWGTLHPAVPAAFGESTCRKYVEETLGSVVAVDVREVLGRGPWDLQTPDGPVTFPDAIAATVDFTTFRDDVLSLETHVPVEDGQLFWLTTCGVESP